MVELDFVYSFCEGGQGGLEGSCLPSSRVSTGWTDGEREGSKVHFQRLSGLLAQPLQIRGISSRAHGSRIVGGEVLLLNFDLGVISIDDHGPA